MSINSISAEYLYQDYPKKASAVINENNNTESIFTNENKSFGEKFMDWTKDKDKICTDGADDGKLSFSEGLESFGKGLVSIAKAPFQFVDSIKNAIDTSKSQNASTLDKVKAWAEPALGIALTAGAAAAVVLTGGAAAVPLLAGLGVLGAGKIGYGTYKAATAKTDGDAKKAFETMGSGVTDIALTGLGAGNALAQASKAGVYSANSAQDMNIAQQFIQLYKSTPQAMKVGGNVLMGNSGGVLAGNSISLAASEDVDWEIAQTIDAGKFEKVFSNLDYKQANKMMENFGIFAKDPVYTKNISMDPTHEFQFFGAHSSMQMYDTTAKENVLTVASYLSNPIKNLGTATNAENAILGAAEGAVLIDKLNELN